MIFKDNSKVCREVLKAKIFICENDEDAMKQISSIENSIVHIALSVSNAENASNMNRNSNDVIAVFKYVSSNVDGSNVPNVPIYTCYSSKNIILYISRDFTSENRFFLYYQQLKKKENEGVNILGLIENKSVFVHKNNLNEYFKQKLNGLSKWNNYENIISITMIGIFSFWITSTVLFLIVSAEEIGGGIIIIYYYWYLSNLSQWKRLFLVVSKLNEIRFLTKQINEF